MTRANGKPVARGWLDGMAPAVLDPTGGVPIAGRGRAEKEYLPPHGKLQNPESPTPAAVSIFIPIKTGRGLNNREHYMARYRREKREKECAAWSLLAKQPPPLPVTVFLVRVTPRKQMLDDDNLVGALKAIRDLLASWLRVDDADPRVAWRYSQESSGRKEWGVSVLVYPRGET